MPYPQDLVGKYITHKLNMGGGMTSTMTLDENGLLPGQTKTANVGIYRDITTNTDRLEALGKRMDFSLQPGDDQTTKMRIARFEEKSKAVLPKVDATYTHSTWQFTYLNYVCGAVTTANLPPAVSVLSGPFSGCYFFKYTIDGVVNVAHVGTFDDQNHKLSKRAKRAWMKFAGEDKVTNIRGGQPIFSDAELQPYVDPIAGTPIILGCMSLGGAYFLGAIPIVGTRNTLKTDLLKIVIVKSFELSPFDRLNPPNTFRELGDDE
jgi:hypothetical protein